MREMILDPRLVTAVIIGILAFAGLIFVLAKAQASKPDKPVTEAEYKVLAEGVYDHTEYVAKRFCSYTVIYFDDGRTVLMRGLFSILSVTRGARIRVVDNGYDSKIEKLEEPR